MFFKYPGSSILSQLSASMGSSKQLHQNYSNIAKSCNVPISSVTKKWQLPDQWSDHHSKGAERTVHGIARKASQNPYLTTEDLQVDLTDSGVVVQCLTVDWLLHKDGLHERVIRRKPLLCSHYKIRHQNLAKEHLNKSDAFWKQVLQTGEVKTEVAG